MMDTMVDKDFIRSIEILGKEMSKINWEGGKGNFNKKKDFCIDILQKY